ncbi:hypothetical protein [Desulfosporosinus sp. SB140]|uniref:hypothetical protein n=1 Tax=Desulfosporosinus paludis TaxID=3115649 RepID=UPI00388ECF4C
MEKSNNQKEKVANSTHIVKLDLIALDPPMTIPERFGDAPVEEIKHVTNKLENIKY